MPQWKLKVDVLNEYWAKINEWWSGLAKREKQAVSIGGACFALFIVYQGIWSPLTEKAVSLRKRIVSQQKTLTWMQAADKTLATMEGQTKSRSKTNSPVVLLSVMQKQINQAGLSQSLTQLKQVSNDSIEVHFQKVDFDKLIKLLTTVIKQQSVTITQMSAIAEGTPGVVNADMVIRI